MLDAFVVGTLVGISVMFSGISRFMLSLAIRDLSQIAAPRDVASGAPTRIARFAIQAGCD